MKSRTTGREANADPSESLGRSRLRPFFVLLGPVMAGLCYAFLPASYEASDQSTIEFSHAGRATLAIMVWMAAWWLSEAIDIYATALLPIASFPVLGIADVKDAASPYAHPLIFLFLGGFLLALSMQRWGLDRRIALLTLRLVGTRPAHMVGGFMMATALLSGFVSNTATAAMMLPIAMSVVALVSESDGKKSPSQDERNFATCLMLAIAYSASVGGMVTIIGTPPNVFMVSFLRDMIAERYRMEISFVRWLLIGLPLAIVLLPTIWIMLTKVMFPIHLSEIEGGSELIRKALANMGPPNRGELATLLVFLLTAALWITRPLLVRWRWPMGDEGIQPFAELSDAGVVMLTVLILFMIPVRDSERTHVMDWSVTSKLPWGILILFGGGLSLAAAVDANGVAEFVGSQSVFLSSVPPIVLILAVTAAIVFLTELTSNIATTATALPLLAALAPGLGIHPYLLVIPAAIASSCAFMLPVATPPNAIVFASGRISMGQMARTGFWLNLVCIVFTCALAVTIIGPVFGVDGP